MVPECRGMGTETVNGLWTSRSRIGFSEEIWRRGLALSPAAVLGVSGVAGRSKSNASDVHAETGISLSSASSSERKGLCADLPPTWAGDSFV